MAGGAGTGSPGAGGSGMAGSPGTGGTSAGSAGTGGFGGYPDPGVCGNGVPEWGEECDLGDTADGDGCSSVCMLEPGYTCDWQSCRLAVCGDGLQDWYALGGGVYAYEQCDDGNAIGADGCSSSCEVEPGFVCYVPGEACREVRCGDGFQDGYFVPGDPSTGGSGGSAGSGMAGAGGGGSYYFEGCDDGNESSGDGCSATCETEAGYICEVPGTACRQPRCGDGFQDFIWTPDAGSGGSSMGGFGGSAGAGTGFYEQCDDGNVASGDGCTSDCDVEDGYVCTLPGTPCRIPTCGDGFIDFIPNPDGCVPIDGVGGGSSGAGGSAGTGSGGFAGGGVSCGTYEECDDGNTASSDGCSSACTAEDGYVCYEPGGPCRIPECGDGWVDWPVEECDDGNAEPGDGCHDCVVEW